MNFCEKLFQTKLLSRLSHKVCRLLSSPVLLRKFTNIQRHSELRDLEAEMLRMVCNDVEVERVLQEVTGEILNHGANKAPDAPLNIHARGFWETR